MTAQNEWINALQRGDIMPGLEINS